MDYSIYNKRHRGSKKYSKRPTTTEKKAEPKPKYICKAKENESKHQQRQRVLLPIIPPPPPISRPINPAFNQQNRKTSKSFVEALKTNLPLQELPLQTLKELKLVNLAPPTGIRNFKHKLFAKFHADQNNNNVTTGPDLLERAPSHKMVETQLLYTMARQHESSLLLTNQMAAIRKTIEKDLQNLHQNRGLALSSDAIGCLFSMCDTLKVQDRVKYAAAEIYDRFMINYNEYMVKETAGLNMKTRREAEIRLQGQTMLRLATCIQLATKFFNDGDGNKEAISNRDIYHLLAQYRQTYTVKGIDASELRILKLLNYNVNCITTLDVIENILIQLELDIPFYRKIYEICTYLLDYLYYDHEEIYNFLFSIGAAKTPQLDRNHFKTTEYNKLAEASGIVSCCIYLMKPLEYKIYQHAISSITKIDEHTFTDLAAILVKCMND